MSTIETTCHIDQFLDQSYDIRDEGLAYAHFMFSHFRQPAMVRMLHDRFMRRFKLFVDHKGETYRVTGASRLGDIWLTKNFDQDHGYQLRVDFNPKQQTNWREKADYELTWPERWRVGVRFHGILSRGNEVPQKRSSLVKELDEARVPRTLLKLGVGERQYVLTELAKELRS